jgi:hypothetical protein
MENRRFDYRHTFPPDDRLRVEISTTRGRRLLTGEIINLSVGGMAVALGDGAAPPRESDRVRAHFAIPHGLRRLALESAVVHTPAGEGPFGLRFLALDDPDAQDEREKALWVFLLDEQRRLRRQLRGEA